MMKNIKDELRKSVKAEDMPDEQWEEMLFDAMVRLYQRKVAPLRKDIFTKLTMKRYGSQQKETNEGK